MLGARSSVEGVIPASTAGQLGWCGIAVPAEGVKVWIQSGASCTLFTLLPGAKLHQLQKISTAPDRLCIAQAGLMHIEISSGTKVEGKFRRAALCPSCPRRARNALQELAVNATAMLGYYVQGLLVSAARQALTAKQLSVQPHDGGPNSYFSAPKEQHALHVPSVRLELLLFSWF